MGTYRTLSHDDIDEILAAFATGGHLSATAIAAGTINTNYAVDVAPGLPAGRRFLRVNEGKSREDVAREAAIIGHVAARGVPTPRPLCARNGEPFVLWKDVYVSLFPWVEGRVLTRADVGPREAESAGAALARLHIAGADFPDRRPGRYEIDELERRVRVIAEQAGDDPALAAAVAVLGPTLAALRRERVAGLPAGLIHADMFIDNVIYRGQTLAALLDFEMASWGTLVYDLAISVLAFGFGADDFRPEVTRAFIEGYRAIRPVSADEERAFGAELRFAACRFAVTRITDVYMRRDSGAPGGKDFRRYLARLAAVERHLAGDGTLFRLT